MQKRFAWWCVSLCSQWHLFSHWLQALRKYRLHSWKHVIEMSSVPVAAFYVQVEVKQHGSSLEGKPLGVVQVCSLTLRAAENHSL